MATEAERDAALESLFAAGRIRPEVPDDLTARLMAGAAEAAARPAPVPARRRAGLGALVLSVLGGWPAMAGMTAAAGVGVWLGFSDPELVNGYIGGDSYTLGDFMPDLSLLAEGG